MNSRRSRLIRPDDLTLGFEYRSMRNGQKKLQTKASGRSLLAGQAYSEAGQADILNRAFKRTVIFAAYEYRRGKRKACIPRMLSGDSHNSGWPLV